RRSPIRRPAPSLLLQLCVMCSGANRGPHPFPTRRPSDLVAHDQRQEGGDAEERERGPAPGRQRGHHTPSVSAPRWPKSPASAARSEEHTSELQHVSISYAVFCLKKKKLGSTRARSRPFRP